MSSASILAGEACVKLFCDSEALTSGLKTAGVDMASFVKKISETEAKSKFKIKFDREGLVDCKAGWQGWLDQLSNTLNKADGLFTTWFERQREYEDLIQPPA